MGAQVIDLNGYRTTVQKHAAMRTRTKRKITEHAAAAKLIKKDLKAAFPSVKFSVRSSTFAGGDAIDIGWTDGPTTKQVERITGKYQYGHFDGMIDCYEATNMRQDIPQTKYVQTQRRYSDEVMQHAIDWVNQRYGYRLRAREGVSWFEVDRSTDELTPGGWASDALHREALHVQPFICETCQSSAHVGDDYFAECGHRLTERDR